MRPYMTLTKQGRVRRLRKLALNAPAQYDLDVTGLRVIHIDLWHDNIKVDHGRLRPFDFEDTIWGYPVQDIAMALQDLMRHVPPEDFAELQRAFRCGYESQSPWPEHWPGEIDTLRAGRMLWVCNYVARFERQYLSEHIEWVTPMFERFLVSALLKL